MGRIIAVPLVLLILFSKVYSDSDAPAAPMKEEEQDTLYLAIQDMVRKSWNGSELYPDPCGWTPIQGVSCDLYNGWWYITVLSFGPILDNSLECAVDARFSPYLFQLKHLRSLTFYNCFSSPIHHPTTIPSEGWESLAGSLESLELRSNRGIVGGIPDSIGELISLQSLVLVDNALSGELPHPQIGNLVHLKRLVLSGNQLSGGIPASLSSNLAQLLILDLSRNYLTGPLPASLGGLNSLLKLDLSYNYLDGELPVELGGLKNLTLLDLKSNNFTGGLPPSLQGLVSIQDLILADNPMGGNLMEFGWEKHRNLTSIHLSNMGLTGEIPESMTELKRLRSLALDNNHLSGPVSPKLASLPSLRALYLNGNNLTGGLGFPQEFYERMGVRFASWSNPGLCFNAGIVTTKHAPVGVDECKNEQRVSTNNSGSKSKVSSGGHDSSVMASSGLSVTVASSWMIFLMKAAVFLVIISL